jgi:hypothetical protein
LQNEFLETKSIIGFKENLSIQQKKPHLLWFNHGKKNN